MLHDFQDMLHWDDARERVWQSRARSKGGVTPLRFREWKKRRAGYCWSRKASGGVSASGLWLRPRIPVRKVLRQRGWSKSTFYRKVDGGAVHIAAILGERGVAVR